MSLLNDNFKAPNCKNIGGGGSCYGLWYTDVRSKVQKPIPFIYMDNLKNGTQFYNYFYSQSELVYVPI